MKQSRKQSYIFLWNNGVLCRIPSLLKYCSLILAEVLHFVFYMGMLWQIDRCIVYRSRFENFSVSLSSAWCGEITFKINLKIEIVNLSETKTWSMENKKTVEGNQLSTDEVVGFFLCYWSKKQVFYFNTTNWGPFPLFTWSCTIT